MLQLTFRFIFMFQVSTRKRISNRKPTSRLVSILKKKEAAVYLSANLSVLNLKERRAISRYLDLNARALQMNTARAFSHNEKFKKPAPRADLRADNPLCVYTHLGNKKHRAQARVNYAIAQL